MREYWFHVNGVTVIVGFYSTFKHVCVATRFHHLLDTDTTCIRKLNLFVMGKEFNERNDAQDIQL